MAVVKDSLESANIFRRTPMRLSWRYEDGWILARNESSGGVGLLPRNFLDVENARVGNVGTRSPTVRTASLVTRKGRDGGGKTGATSAAGSSTLQPPAAAPPAVTASSPDGKERLVGICEYIPQNSDEIRLNVGDKVSVLFTYEDGWILGKNETLSVVGLLPRNFLDKDTGAPPAAQSSFSRTPTVRTASLVVRNNQQQSSGPKPALPTSSAAPAAAPVASVPLVSSTPITTPSSYQISQQTQQQQAPAIPRGSNDPASLRNAAAYPPPLLPPIKLDGPNASADTAATAKKKLAASVKARNNRMKIPANMGTLKLAVVGDLSIGKTSLIKKFLQMTEIVLADPLPPASASGSIREIRASTIPAAELQVGEERLNLTFVDTPGYGASMDALAIIGPVGEYCLTQYGKSEKAFSREITRNQIIRFMNAGTGAHSHVDVCIYGILHRITPIDLEYMRRLSRFVTIVPVILKCDTMFKAEVTRLKVEVLEALAACGVRIYGFGLSHEECTALARGGELGAPPFAVSCLDEEESTPAAGMKGRCESEFDTLKTALFFNHIGDLRNMSAEKFADWYEC
ncbi:Septin-domain-containing protein [Zopfochytrium polystomum]|nr:Septin-domain-containing protein [Zopfochytrium polystomum]